MTGLTRQERFGWIEAGYGACTVLAPCPTGVGTGVKGSGKVTAATGNANAHTVSTLRKAGYASTHGATA